MKQALLPLIDKESIEFTSRRYGKIWAVKRAYQIPDDDGTCLAWLATLANTVGVDLEKAVQDKYGAGCPGCGESPCVCAQSEKP